MKVKDLMNVLVIPEEYIKIWDNYEAISLTRNELNFRPELHNREIDFMYTAPELECICITLINN